MRDGHPADYMPAALVLMQPAFGVCFVLWWALRKLFEVKDRRAGEPLRAPDARNDDADAGALPAAPDRRLRLESARPAARRSSSSQHGGARPLRRTASPAATHSERAPDDPRERWQEPSPPAPTVRRRSEAQRSASNQVSGAANDLRTGTSRDDSRPARPARAMETRAARGDPAFHRSSAAPPETLPRCMAAPSQAAGQASGTKQTALAALQFAVNLPPVMNHIDSSAGDDDCFVMRPRPAAAADFIEVDSAVHSFVNAEYAQRFRAGKGEGWI